MRHRTFLLPIAVGALIALPAGAQPVLGTASCDGLVVSDVSIDPRPPDLSGFTKRWREIQVGFVDEPRDSVAQADTLVADLMQQLAASFSDERQRLETQWDSGNDVSTEDLRVALTRYRSFFDRLLSA